jgi:hypothetical protein
MQPQDENHDMFRWVLGPRYDHLHDVIIHFFPYVYMRFLSFKGAF